MTVRDLLAILANAPPELEVFIGWQEEDGELTESPVGSVYVGDHVVIDEEEAS